MTQSTAVEEIGPLISGVARLWRTCLDQRLQSLGLSQAKWIVLLLLARSEDGLLQHELAERCGVEASTMAVLLSRMEREGWVRRRVDSRDRRAKRTWLTARAQKMAGKVFEEARRLREDVLEPLDDAELQRCVSCLLVLQDRLQSLKTA